MPVKYKGILKIIFAFTNIQILSKYYSSFKKILREDSTSISSTIICKSFVLFLIFIARKSIIRAVNCPGSQLGNLDL